MNISRKLPIGVQSFKVLREDHYLYVDKTQYLFRLVQSGRVSCERWLLSRSIFFQRFFNILERPIVVAGSCRHAVAAERRCARPIESAFGKKVFVGKCFDKRHHLFMRFFKHCFRIRI